MDPQKKTKQRAATVTSEQKTSICVCIVTNQGHVTETDWKEVGRGGQRWEAIGKSGLSKSAEWDRVEGRGAGS